MNLINYLNQNVRVKVDRPLGSKHPTHGFIYPVNYGSICNKMTRQRIQDLLCFENIYNNNIIISIID